MMPWGVCANILTHHWRRRSAVGDFAAVFTWQVWDKGEPRKGVFFFFFFLEVGRGESQWRAEKTQRWTFAYSEGFAVTERAGKCIDISVHLSVCLRWGSYPEEGPSFSKWLLPNLDLLLLLSSRPGHPTVGLTSPFGILQASQTHSVPKEHAPPHPFQKHFPSIKSSPFEAMTPSSIQVLKPEPTLSSPIFPFLSLIPDIQFISKVARAPSKTLLSRFLFPLAPLPQSQEPPGLSLSAYLEKPRESHTGKLTLSFFFFCVLFRPVVLLYFIFQIYF